MISIQSNNTIKAIKIQNYSNYLDITLQYNFLKTTKPYITTIQLQSNDLKHTIQ